MYILLTSLVFIFIFLLNKFIINPILQIRYYKKQGIKNCFFMPILGIFYYFTQSYLIHRDSLYFLKEFLKNNPNEKIIMTNIFGDLAFLVVDPVCLRDFLVTNMDKMKANHDLLGRPYILNDNLVISEGEYWKKSRKMHSFAFNYDNLIKQTPIMATIVESNLKNIKLNEDFNVLNFLCDVIGKFTLRSIMGAGLDNILVDGKSIHNATHCYIETILKRMLSLPFLFFGDAYYCYIKIGKEGRISRGMMKLRNIVNEFIEKQIEIKKKKVEKENEFKLLDHMIKLKLEDENFKEINLTDEFLTICNAAIDTTTNLTLFILIKLSENPVVLSELTKEIENNIKSNDDFELNKINSLVYLDAVIKETLRVQHPAPLGINKISISEVKIGPFSFKKNTHFFPFLYANMINEKYFEEPFLFKPERWINQNSSLKKNQESFTFIPFSAGPRNCIGQHFSQMETKVIIIKLLKNFEFKIKQNFKYGWILKETYTPDSDIPFEFKNKLN